MKTTTMFKTATLGDGNVGDTVKFYNCEWTGMKGVIVGFDAFMSAWRVQVGNVVLPVLPGRCVQVGDRPFTPVSK